MARITGNQDLGVRLEGPIRRLVSAARAVDLVKAEDSCRGVYNAALAVRHALLGRSPRLALVILSDIEDAISAWGEVPQAAVQDQVANVRKAVLGQAGQS
jgi:hypothetical protein